MSSNFVPSSTARQSKASAPSLRPNLANGKSVNIGEAVGVIAAQSIGEPGTS
jgi:hypothetical protein